MDKMKVGIIGAGPVAQALGSGFLGLGWDVMLGTRNAAKLADWNARHKGKAMIGSAGDAANFGGMVVLAVKGSAAESAVRALSGALAGKTVIDTTNPIEEAPPENGVLRYSTDINFSLMERLQKIVPSANFVKAFSCVGSALMVNPKLPGGVPTMFIAGDNEPAKTQVKAILGQFGWDVADMGKAEAARAIEPLAMLWCIPGFVSNDWMHAFKLLKA